MASTGNQHCGDRIGTHSFPIKTLLHQPWPCDHQTTAAYSCMRSVDAEIVGSGGESEQASQQSEELGGLAADSDWHALTQKEEADLDTIMSQCEFAISNAEKFADQLSRDLSVLDGVCACAICVCFERDMYFLFCKCFPT